MNRLIFAIIMALLASCRSMPIIDLDQQALKHGLTNETVVGGAFKLVYLANNKAGSTLHIYIEGDGLPWLNRHTISSNPTPKNPLALGLMIQDKSNAIYLARPCYFILHENPNCTAELWTDARYGEKVLASMQHGIRQIIQRQKITKVVLIGYSGGGVLASLLSERIAESEFYVTVAANLDTQQWTGFHQYSPLVNSISPSAIFQRLSKPAIHFVGALDKVVPAKTSEAFIKKTNGKRIVFDSYDHTCCWIKNWSNRLSEISAFKKTIISN